VSKTVLNKWLGYYTLADCACEYCLYYGGKKKGCQLEKCCCAEEIKEAQKRKNAKLNNGRAAGNRGPSPF